MRKLLLVLALLAVGCSGTYESPTAKEGASVYLIERKRALNVVEHSLAEELKAGNIALYSPIEGGFKFKIKRTESSVLLVPGPDKSTTPESVMLNVRGEGRYFSFRTSSSELEATMRVVSRIKAALESSSVGVLHYSGEPIIRGVYP